MKIPRLELRLCMICYVTYRAVCVWGLGMGHSWVESDTTDKQGGCHLRCVLRELPRVSKALGIISWSIGSEVNSILVATVLSRPC